MVLIPKVESGQQISKEAPTLRVSEGLFQGPGAELKQTAKALKLMSDQLHKTNIFSEATKGETEARRRLAELELESETDPNFDSKTVQDRIVAIRNEVAESIKIREAKDSFAASYDRLSIGSDFKIRRTLNKKSILKAKANLLDNIDELQGTENREAELDLKLKQGVKELLLNPIQARDLKKKLLKDWDETDIRNAIAVNPDTAKKALLKGEFDTTADETSKWVQVANQRIARIKKEEDKIHTQKWLDNGAELAQNLRETSVEDLIQMVANDEIDPFNGNEAITWKTKEGTVQYEEDKKIWMEIVRDSLSPEQDLAKFQQRVFKAMSDGKIQWAQGAELMTQVRSLFETAIEFKSRPPLKDRLIKSGLDLIDNVTKLAFPKERGLINAFNMTNELLRRTKDGNVKEEDISKITTQVINEQRVQDNPIKLGLIGIEGQLRMDPEGNKARVFSDGRIEEID